MTWLDGIAAIPSPSHYEGRRGFVADVLMLHYSVGNGDSLRLGQLFANPALVRSAHFGVGRKGDVAQYVALDDGAWAAGDKKRSRFPSSAQLEQGDVRIASVPRMPREVNSRAVAIELCNRGFDVGGLPESRVLTARHQNPRSSSTRWESFPFEQLAALERLVARIVAAVPTLRWVCGHEDVTHFETTGAGSKLDPGPAFPWVVVANRFGLRRVFFDFDARAWRRDAC